MNKSLKSDEVFLTPEQQAAFNDLHGNFEKALSTGDKAMIERAAKEIREYEDTPSTDGYVYPSDQV